MDVNIDTGTFSQRLLDRTIPHTFLINFLADSIHFLIRLLICVVFYYVTLKIIRWIVPFFRKSWAENMLEDSLRTFVKSALNIALHIALITICLRIIGIRESSLIAFFGTLGIGIGLALKDNLSNFAGGIIILVFEVYKVGDEVWVDGHSGYVDSIDIFSTNIRAHNGDLIVVPNGQIVTEKIINYDKTPFRRLKFIVSVGYDTDIEKVRNILENLLRSNPLVIKEPPVTSNVEEYADSSINIALKGWTSNEHYWIVYHEVLSRLKSVLDEHNINIPYPQMDVHMNMVHEEKTEGEN